jgi:hypothetical protein
MAKYNLKRLDLHCPQYETDATIRVNEAHESGFPHLEVRYTSDKISGHATFAAAIPADWTDQDLVDLIFAIRPTENGRNWPSWEIPANDYATPWLFRWWKCAAPPA